MKVTSLRDAVASYVHDGDTVAIEGFTASICFSAAHEIIRQRRRDLVLCRVAPDLVYDQMVAAGCAARLVYGGVDGEGVDSLRCIRRAAGAGVPGPLELEAYSQHGLIGRYVAAAARLPFFPLRSVDGGDEQATGPLVRCVESPYGDGPVAVVPPLAPDVAIIHAQRADAEGNTQLWGHLGPQNEVVFAARHVIVVVEELVAESAILSNRWHSFIPHVAVSAVVCQPMGAYPSHVEGYYGRDDAFYTAWEQVSQDAAAVQAWLDEWVLGVPDWEGFLAKLATCDPGIWERLAPGRRPAGWQGVVH